jgi:hypothetical protein
MPRKKPGKKKICGSITCKNSDIEEGKCVIGHEGYITLNDKTHEKLTNIMVKNGEKEQPGQQLEIIIKSDTDEVNSSIIFVNPIHQKNSPDFVQKINRFGNKICTICLKKANKSTSVTGICTIFPEKKKTKKNRNLENQNMLA